jgi:hypothetical protein
MPLQITRPAPGTKAVIPSSFLPYRAVPGPGGRGTAPSYDPLSGRWGTMSSSSDTWLRVQLPEEVLPGRLERLSLRLQIEAPSRKLRIAAIQNDEAVTIAERDNPAAVLEITIDEPEHLQLDADGGVRIGLLVSEAFAADRRNAEWQVQDLQLTAEVEVTQ